MHGKFEMWFWRGLEDISCTDHVRNVEVLQRVGGWLILYKKAKSIGKILHVNCLLNNIIEGKIEGRIKVTGRQGRRRKQLITENISYCELKEEALVRSSWKTGF